ncbi:hypothetical protein HFN49_34515 [Rhizobium leguminosarum]|nr:hypothetical protein [Rhizobium leguminosarum]NEI81595.1 hypothetical protein [Rhizobium ruizarguesonis]QSZ05624.1 sensor histidine kinase N-terminal domain-containing protein [Rhizobium ruizarguesonis]
MQAIRLLGASLRIQLLARIFLTLVGAICINLYRSFLTANTTANLIFDQTLMASARVTADDVTVDEAGSNADRRKAAADGQNSGRHKQIELILPI